MIGYSFHYLDLGEIPPLRFLTGSTELHGSYSLLYSDPCEAAMSALFRAKIISKVVFPLESRRDLVPNPHIPKVVIAISIDGVKIYKTGPQKELTLGECRILDPSRKIFDSMASDMFPLFEFDKNLLIMRDGDSYALRHGGQPPDEILALLFDSVRSFRPTNSNGLPLFSVEGVFCTRLFKSKLFTTIFLEQL
jgi:hypothetical protein